MTLTDATMLVAGSMIGSGIFIVSADMARTLPLAALADARLGALGRHDAARRARLRRARGDVPARRRAVRLPARVAWARSWGSSTAGRSSSSSRRARSPPSPSRSAASSACSVPAISPDRFAWFPQADVCIAALGCTDPAQRHPARPHAAAARRRCSASGCSPGSTCAACAKGSSVQTTLTVVKTGALALLICSGSRSGATPTRSPPTSSRGNFVGQSVDSRPRLRRSPSAAALVGSLFSSDAWNNVTFAAAEVKNPLAQPAAGAGARHGARDAALHPRQRRRTSACCRSPAPPTARPCSARGIQSRDAGPRGHRGRPR